MQTRMEQFPATNPNPVLSAGKDGIVLYSNKAGEPLLHEWGVSVGEKLPLHIENIVRRVISLKSPEKIEVKAGNRVYLVSFHPLPEEECVNVYGFDISELKELEVKLRESEEQYRAFFENSIDAVFLTSPDGNIFAANPEACRIFGMTEDEIIRAGRKGVVDTSDPRLQSVLEERDRTGKFKGELNHKRKDGTIFPAEVSTLFFTDINGFVKTSTFIRDITERKRVEEALHEAYENLQLQSEELHAQSEDIQAQNEELQMQSEELHRAYEALLESEKQYRMLFDKSMDGIILTDPRGVGMVLSANPAACKMLGWTEEELILKGLDVIFDVKNPAISTLLDEHIPSGSAKSQINYRRKDGTTLNGEISSTFFIDRNGNPRAVSIIRDITERKRAEEALQKSEEQYRTLFNSMNEGFCIIEVLFNENEKSIDYVFLEVNPAFEGQTGLINAVGKRMRELAPEHEEHWFEIYGKIALTGESIRFENRAEALGRWYEVYAYRVGQPEDRKVAIFFNDIKERKQAEEKICQQAEELETVMETTPVAIWVGHDSQSNNITGNRMANEFYEVEEGENVSANVTPVRRFFHKGIELTADELPMQEAALNDIDIRNVELDVLLQSGKWRFMLGSASPLHDDDGNVRGSVGAFIDITERRQIEMELLESEEKYRNIVELANEGIWGN
jgi:PAS domain S-box-containing protein